MSNLVKIRETINLSLPQATLFRIVAILLLLIAAGEVYACEVYDDCLSFGSSGSIDDCDQPSGDNCLCCCRHIVPVNPFSLQIGAAVAEQTPVESDCGFRISGDLAAASGVPAGEVSREVPCYADSPSPGRYPCLRVVLYR